MLMKRDVLHRDMSKFNILMYPRWSTKTKTQMMLNAPPLIRDLLSDEPRYVVCFNYVFHPFLTLLQPYSRAQIYVPGDRFG